MSTCPGWTAAAFAIMSQESSREAHCLASRVRVDFGFTASPDGSGSAGRPNVRVQPTPEPEAKRNRVKVDPCSVTTFALSGRRLADRRDAGPRARSARLERVVYARHGHELMGCKSPVGDPALSTTMATTSRRQGHRREALSEGSPSANARADGQKPHRRPGSWASQHNMTKPAGVTGQGKCGGCVRKVHAPIRGDLLDWRPALVTGAGLRPGGKRLESPPDPATSTGSAPTGNRERVRAEVSRRHSSQTPTVMGGTR